MAKAAAAQSAELALIDDVASFYADPYGFVVYAFDWGRGDLSSWSGPDDWQSALLRDVGAKIQAGGDAGAAIREATASGHGIGKTALVSWLILWFMSTRPMCAGVVTANTKDQLVNKTWRELAVWHRRAINAHWFEWTATKFAAVEAPGEWFIAAQPWSKERSEAFAGLHAKDVLVIFDEASAIDDVIFEVTEGAMTTAGAMWFAFGNPTRNTGAFAECFGRQRHRWGTRQVDSRTAKAANRAQIDQWVADYGEDSDFVRVRVRGAFPRAGSTEFIGPDLVREATGREGADHGPRIIGVDVARFGDDQSVILIRKGHRIERLHKYRGLDTVAVAGRVAEFINEMKPDAVFVDGVGVGAGVVDTLRALGFCNIIREVNAGNTARDEKAYTNKGAEMWGLMREWLREGGALPDDRELEADLTGRQYGFDLKGRIQLEKKSDMKDRGLASPDIADALAMTFAYPVASPDVHERLSKRIMSGRAKVGHSAVKDRYRR